MSNPDYAKFKRDEHGLLPGITYVYNDDGSVNWRKMIKPEHLVIQRGKEAKVVEQYGKAIDELDLREIDDKYLMILLAGIKYLARIRGILNCEQLVNVSTIDNATVTCSITFLPNYETDRHAILFSDVGTATMDSTTGFGQKYLATMAANRAFVRTVRNFLNVNIVATDEMKEGVTEEPTESTSIASGKPFAVLASKAAEKKVTFDDIKKAALTKYRAEMTGDPEKWTEYKNVDPVDAWVLLGKLDKKA